MSTLNFPRQNRQEFLYYLLAATVLLFGLGAAGLSLWYAIPVLPSTKVEVGTLADFESPERPYLVTGHEADHRFWVVNTGEEVFAFLARTPNMYWSDAYGEACLFAWNEATNRFEDPCSGDKFGLTGELVEASGRGPLRTQLDRYGVEVTADGRVIVDFETVIVTDEVVNSR